MPRTPNVGPVCPTDMNRVLSKEEYEHYRTDVGMLFYLVKHMLSDIVNAVR